ncbi:TcpD family membrane protein [Streptomyces jumonjinensis]|uniref:TcpD family membrane protein n=1 Tax=Streptomyces jumonjinensis TaxID=1945 RepID=UPI0037AE3D45
MPPLDLMLAAPLTTGSELKDWFLIVAGNVFMVFLVARAIGHFIKKEWGEMITLIIAAAFVGGLVWAPETVQDMLEGLWGKVSGTA